MHVNIVDFPETKVALLVHRGPESKEMQTVRKFIRWRRENGCGPDKSGTYSIFYDDPNTIAPEDYRFGVCAAVDGDIEDNAYGVVNSLIPAGRCAVLRQIGSPNHLDQSARYLLTRAEKGVHPSYTRPIVLGCVRTQPADKQEPRRTSDAAVLPT
jgi:AraC family transcriptional regulator